MGLKKEKKVKKGSPAWMATFSDLMTLLLVFFILLFSFSEIDANKFRMIANSFKGVFDESSEFILDNPPTSPIELDFPPVDMEKSLDTGEKDENQKQLDELLAEVKSYLEEHDLEGVITATREERGVELVLQEDVLFDSGQAVVKQQAKPFLDTVADLLITIPNLVEIEGHTDSQRIIQPSIYVSNWNLSGDRAANVANYFIKEHLIPADRFKISGFADTMPLDTNITAEGRMKNRRVVIVILDKNYDDYKAESVENILSNN
ncbi:MAG: flagellar motor protein MotB [Vulcanibacillus sp.]